MKSDFNSYLVQHRENFQHQLLSHLPPSLKNSFHLNHAINYSALQNGKRLRPLLVYATGETLGASTALLDTAACAIEMVHIFSLIHDDLPAMDNDDWRRGQPTCHKKFDEATAILAGDALLALAFKIISQEQQLTYEQRVAMVATLATATGQDGMIAGQSLDMQVTANISLVEIENMYLLKTGALFRASTKLAAIAANLHQQSNIINSLDLYAEKLGLAFQIKDDLADFATDKLKTNAETIADKYTSTTISKPTYVSLSNAAKTQEKLQQLKQEALAALTFIPFDTTLLVKLAQYIL